MSEKTLEQRLQELYNKRDHIDQFYDADLKTVIDAIRDAREHGGTASVGITPISGGGGYTITITDSGGTEHTATVKDGGDAYEVYKSTVPSGETPMSKTEWLASLKGEDGANGQDGADGAPGHNPCLGRFTSEPNPMPAGQVGDYFYVDITTTDQTTQEETTTTTVYHYGSNGWDGGTDIDADHPTLASGQAVTSVRIKDKNGVEVSGSADVLSAEAGKNINDGLQQVKDELVVVTHKDVGDIVANETAYLTQKVMIVVNSVGNNVSTLTRVTVTTFNTYKISLAGYKRVKFWAYLSPNGYGSVITDADGLVLSEYNEPTEAQYVDVDIPNGAAYLYYAVKPTESVYTLDLVGTSSRIEQLEDKMGDGEFQTTAQTAVGAINELNRVVNDFEVEVHSTVERIAITSNNHYSSVSSPAGASFFEIDPGGEYMVVPQDGKKAIIAILQNINNVSSGSTPAFSSEYGSRIELDSAETLTFVCPDDAHYMYMLHNPSSETYGLGKVLSISKLSRFEGKIIEPISYRMTLERGVLFGGHVTNNNLYYNGCVPFGNYGLDNPYWQCTFNYIAAAKSVVVVGLSGYILYEFDEKFNFVKQTAVEDATAGIELSGTTRYIKLSTPNAATEVVAEWVQGGVNDTDTPSANRIKTTMAVDSFNHISYGDGMVLYMAFYDSNMNKIGTANGIRGCRVVPKSAVMASFTAYNGGNVNNVAYIMLSLGYDSNANISTDAAGVLSVCTQANEPLKAVTINTYGESEIVKNDATADKTINIVYPVMANDGSQRYSKMLVRFPSSYSNKGVPTKVIVFKTGSTGFRYLTTTEHLYIQQLQYWVDMGYAVMDFHGATSKYPNDDSFGSPTQLSSAAAAWRWLCDHYNVQSDWCYLASKSLGGVLGHLIVQNKVLPVRAYAALASTPTNTTYCFGYYADFRQHFCEDAGLELTAEEEAFMATPAEGYIPIANHNSATFRGILSKNILNGKLRGYLPMYNLTLGLSASDFAALDAEVANSFANVTLVCQVPYRHWVAEDDIDVPLRRIANYVSEVQNAGAPATLRVLTAGQGAHHAVDNATNAPKVENVTTRLGVFYASVPLAYVEALNFLEVH